MDFSIKQDESGILMKPEVKVNILQNEKNSVKNINILPRLIIRSIPPNKIHQKKTKRNGKGYHWVCVKYSGSVPTPANRCFVKLTPMNFSTMPSAVSRVQRNQAVKAANAAVIGYKTKKSKKIRKHDISNNVKPCSIIIEPLDLGKYRNSQVTSKKALPKDPGNKMPQITKTCLVLVKPLPSQLFGILKHCSISVKSLPKETLPYNNNKLSKPGIKTISTLKKESEATPNNCKLSTNTCSVILQPLSTKVARTLSPVKIHLPKLPDKLLEYIPDNIRKAATSPKKSKLKSGKVFSPKKRSRASDIERICLNLGNKLVGTSVEIDPKSTLNLKSGNSNEPPFKKLKKCTLPNLNEKNIRKAASPKKKKLKAGKVFSPKKRSMTSETEICLTLRNRHIGTNVEINPKQALDLKICNSNETPLKKSKKSALPNVNKVVKKRFVESNRQNLPKTKVITKTSYKKSLDGNIHKTTVKSISTKKHSQIPTTLQNGNENDDLDVRTCSASSQQKDCRSSSLVTQIAENIDEIFSSTNRPVKQSRVMRNKVRTNWFNNICLPITKFNRKIAQLRAQELQYKETATSSNDSATEFGALLPSPIFRSTPNFNNPSTVSQLSVSSTCSPTSTAMILRKISELDQSRQGTPTLLSTFFVPRVDNDSLVVSRVAYDYDTEDHADLLSESLALKSGLQEKTLCTIDEVVSDSTSDTGFCNLKDKQKNKLEEKNGSNSQTNLLEAVENDSNCSEKEKSGKEVANLESNEPLGGHDANNSARNIQTQTEPLESIIPNSWQLGKPIGDPKVLLEAWLQWTEMHKNELLYQSF